MILKYLFLLNIIAGLILASAQTIYIAQVIKRVITPSLLTWMGWSILVGVSLISQIIELGWHWTLIGHLFSTLGCIFIFLFSLFSRNFIIQSRDWKYLVLGIICILLYLLYSDPWTTTIFAILADVILGIPTIIKAYRNPKTERTIGWNIALISWTLTLITCFGQNVLFLLFPAYCFLFNITMSTLTHQNRLEVNGATECLD